jgi:hypothetical protein
VLADSAYGGGQTRAGLRAAGHLQAIKPLPLRAAVPEGVTKDDFAIDLDQQTVTCPAGHTVGITPSSQVVFASGVQAARCGRVAPPPRTARPCGCIPMKLNW